MLLFACEKTEVKQSAEQLVLAKISERLETRNFISPDEFDNPKKDIASYISVFKKKFVKSAQQTQFSRQKTIQYEDLKMGISDSAGLQKFTDFITTFNNENGVIKRTDFETIKSINKELNQIPRIETVDGTAFSLALNRDGVSNAQKKVLDLLLSRIAYAKTKGEALSINATVGYEVANSKLDVNDKNFILSVTALTDQGIDGIDSSRFKPTATVLAGVATVAVATVVGALIGGAITTVDCCLLDNDCNWDCIDQGVYMGAAIGFAAGMLAVTSGVFIYEV